MRKAISLLFVLILSIPLGIRAEDIIDLRTQANGRVVTQIPLNLGDGFEEMVLDVDMLLPNTFPQELSSFTLVRNMPTDKEINDIFSEVCLPEEIGTKWDLQIARTREDYFILYRDSTCRVINEIFGWNGVTCRSIDQPGETKIASAEEKARKLLDDLRLNYMTPLPVCAKIADIKSTTFGDEYKQKEQPESFDKYTYIFTPLMIDQLPLATGESFAMRKARGQKGFDTGGYACIIIDDQNVVVYCRIENSHSIKSKKSSPKSLFTWQQIVENVANDRDLRNKKIIDSRDRTRVIGMSPCLFISQDGTTYPAWQVAFEMLAYRMGENGKQIGFYSFSWYYHAETGMRLNPW